MKKILFAVCAAMVSCSCMINVGNGGKKVYCKGPVMEKSLELSDFGSIVVNGAADVELTQADEFSVVVRANEEVFQHLNYRVEDGVLLVETLNRVQLRAKVYEVYISLPCLEMLTVNGASDVNLKKGYESSENLSIQVNGAGDFDLQNVSVPKLSFTVNGAGDIKAEGLEVDYLAVQVNGAGDVVAAGKATEAFFGVSGAGEINVVNLEMEHWDVQRHGVASIKLPKKQ